MSRCQCCNRNKIETKEYGGSLLCCNCMNIYNPKTQIVEKLDSDSIKRITNKISELKSEINKLEHSLSNNERLFKDTDCNKISATNGYWNY